MSVVSVYGEVEFHTIKNGPPGSFFRDRPFSANKPKRSGLLLVTAVELVNPARRIDELLLAGEERVALRADADLVLRTGGLDMPDFAAGAGDDGIFVFRMNILFHFAQLRFQVILYFC